jgi:hypothetical protein
MGDVDGEYAMPDAMIAPTPAAVALIEEHRK